MGDLVERLLAELRADASAQRLPEATYRLQFHAGFTFKDAAAIVPYLRDLGITHCYASPYLKARPGSMHGYDVLDHSMLNPEIGTLEDYEAFVQTLSAHGMGQILDTVPNHMGIVGNENRWWNDVLENGPASPYANYFDISWQSSPRPELQGRVLLPILGSPYGEALESGQLRPEYSGGALTICYFDHRFPAAPRRSAQVMDHGLKKLEEKLPAGDPALIEYQSILTAIRHLPGFHDTAPEKVAERQREKEVIKRRLGTLTQDNDVVREVINDTIKMFSGTPGEPRSFDALDELLANQAYRLSFWRVASDEINYRRFFDINELAALSQERLEVFQATHELILRLLGQGKVDGLRIDHPDGLFDPREYLERLHEHYLLARARHFVETRPEFQGTAWKDIEPALTEQLRGTRQTIDSLVAPLFIVVEKILGSNEPLPDHWPVRGTSGYDFVNMVNGLFVDSANATSFTRFYQDVTGDDTPFSEVVYQKKFLILRVALSSELHTVSHQLDRLAQKNRWSRDFTLTSLRHALREIIACFPVYRSYIRGTPVHESDQKYVERAVARAKARNPAISSSVFNFARDMLLLKYPAGSTDSDMEEQRRFAGKFQQVTAPVMAKGLEDTAFYVYNRLVSLNEVGGDPGRFGLTPGVLHRYFQDRQARWPGSLSPLSTHDTKRSEDVRARINVLSEIPDDWQAAATRWMRYNESQRTQIEEEGPAPDRNEEYFLYQTLIGAWPLEPYDDAEYQGFVERIKNYMRKALQEAKVHTSWVNPNPAYDDAVQNFIARVLDPKISGDFLDDFRAFQRKISHFGLINSLAQSLLKLTTPGIPDTYQGTELWDFSLVDPDNRRPVDFERRRQMLQELKQRLGQRDKLVPELLGNLHDGRVKLFVTFTALQCCNANPGLFTTGEYFALETVGSRKDNVFAYLRKSKDRCALIVIPRLTTRLVAGPPEFPVGEPVWQDTWIVMPEAANVQTWLNAFTGAAVENKNTLEVARLLDRFPLGLLTSGERSQSSEG